MRTVKSLIRGSLMLLAMGVCVSASAQMTPIGTWHSFDEKSGEIKSELVIEEANGFLRGYISKLLRKDADQKRLCSECSDERKDKPVLGMEIIRGAKKEQDEAATDAFTDRKASVVTLQMPSPCWAWKSSVAPKRSRMRLSGAKGKSLIQKRKRICAQTNADCRG